MKVYNTEITEEQAKYLLKCRKEKYIRGHKLYYYQGFDFVQEFEKLFDEQGYTYDPKELNSDGVERAICDIIRNGNPKASFYAASILRDSAFPISIFEKIVLQQDDYEAQVAYATTLPCATVQKMANKIAASNIPYYNLTLLLNCNAKFDKSQNIHTILKYGSVPQIVVMAKNVPNLRMERIRQIVLKSLDAKGHYLFAYNINDSLAKKLNDMVNYPARETNYIYNAYANHNDDSKLRMVKQHIDKILKSGDPKYSYKVARNGLLDNNPYIDAKQAYQIAEANVYNGEDVKYMNKYALEVPGADKYKFLEKVKEVGTPEDAEYLEQSLAFTDFLRQTGV